MLCDALNFFLHPSVQCPSMSLLLEQRSKYMSDYEWVNNWVQDCTIKVSVLKCPEKYGSLLMVKYILICTNIYDTICKTIQKERHWGCTSLELRVWEKNEKLNLLHIFKCDPKLLAWEDAKSHWLHLLDFSPLWVFKWELYFLRTPRSERGMRSWN